MEGGGLSSGYAARQHMDFIPARHLVKCLFKSINKSDYSFTTILQFIETPYL